jgi:hypothetical protein
LPTELGDLPADADGPVPHDFGLDELARNFGVDIEE